MFSVRSMARLIDEKYLLSSDVRVHWNNAIPKKISIMLWRIANRRLPTLVNLNSRGVDLDSIRCSVCNNGLETEDHLFVECQVAVILPLQQLNLNEVIWFVDSHLEDKDSKICLDVVVHAFLWVIWLNRNNVSFKTRKPNPSILGDEVKFL